MQILWYYIVYTASAVQPVNNSILYHNNYKYQKKTAKCNMQTAAFINAK
jgi:hypothetical protein